MNDSFKKDVVFLNKIKFLFSDIIIYAFTGLMLVGTVICAFYPIEQFDELLFFGMLYLLIAPVWLKIFTKQKPVFDSNKRFLTRKERGLSIIISIAAESAFIITRFISYELSTFLVVNIGFFLFFNILFFIFYKFIKVGCDGNVASKSSTDKYFYKSDDDVIKDFNVGTVWYSKKKYQIMRETYLKLAKEYSGEKTYDEIEYMVREAIAYKLRKMGSLSIYYALFVLPFIFLLSIQTNNNAFFEFIFWFLIFSASLANAFGVIRAMFTIHNAFTPNEEEGYSKNNEKTKQKKPVN